ncbi:ATP-binding cassette domain-containing protein [Agromyces atrinae]|uniref:ABC transporter ATP-binding protein n=1 Tax=Agromyces atrinae TaxID=592376 RepID=UPI001F59ED50|nr:ATP-binding cassette domain-containing protein [Agromyces atrinae]MCI2959379.1 ATP-binding cassette domain-containing protein [Agromyces atrinae]
MTDSPTPPLLAAENLTFRYPGAERDVLRGVDLSVGPGASLGLVGESGAGKSTILSLLLGLQRPTGGRILVDGAPLDLSRRASRLAYRRTVQTVFQDPYSSLDPRMRVGRSIAEPLRSLGIETDARAREARVAALLADVGLPADAATRYPNAFSGGQRQRIAIARALAAEPRVLLADEPVSALDTSVRLQIIELLQRLARERSLSLLLVSHDLTIVAALCERMSVIESGRIVESGRTTDILTAPSDPYTQRLIAAVPRLPSA